MTFILVALNFVVVVVVSLPAKNAHLKNIFPIGKIFGGQAIDIDQAPWHVSLEDSGYLFCSGSIISANYILTAAHCTDETPAEYIQVRSGSSVLETGGRITPVVEIAQNHKFNSETFDYDVSILRLATGLDFDAYQQAVTLRSREVSAEEIVQVIGWGATKKERENELPITLQAVKIPLISRDDCNARYGGTITDRMICAGEIAEDSCQGDSGGAITVNGTQVGIVSWGHGCAMGDYPAVYAYVMAFIDFVNEKSNGEVQWN